MLQFDETLSKRYEGRKGTEQEIYNRLAVRYREIPYFNGGINLQEFGFNDDFVISIRKILADFDVQVTVSQGRVTLGEISILLPFEGIENVL
jgi:hypothetical protein